MSAPNYTNRFPSGEYQIIRRSDRTNPPPAPGSSGTRSTTWLLVGAILLLVVALAAVGFVCIVAAQAGQHVGMVLLQIVGTSLLTSAILGLLLAIAVKIGVGVTERGAADLAEQVTHANTGRHDEARSLAAITRELAKAATKLDERRGEVDALGAQLADRISGLERAIMQRLDAMQQRQDELERQVADDPAAAAMAERYATITKMLAERIGSLEQVLGDRLDGIELRQDAMEKRVADAAAVRDLAERFAEIAQALTDRIGSVEQLLGDRLNQNEARADLADRRVEDLARLVRIFTTEDQNVLSINGNGRLRPRRPSN